MKIFRLSRNTQRTLLFLSLIGMIGSIAVYAAISQSFPSVTYPSSAAITPLCSTQLVLLNTTRIGGGGLMPFGCSATIAAFSANGGSSTPTFTTTYTSLAVSTTTSCATTTVITSTNAVSLASGSYYYCASVPANGGTVPAFTITWT